MSSVLAKVKTSQVPFTSPSLMSRPVYASLEDFSGHLECLCMKAELARWRDDDASAAHADALYLQLLADKQVTGTTS